MTSHPEWLRIESLDLEGQGVGHNAEGKVVFVEGALPGEDVQVQVHRRKNNWEQGTMTALRRESAQRVTPGCRHFGVCGGCKMQHLQAGAQLAVKQRALEDGLWHLAKVKAEQVLRPVEGPTWGYRYRARLSVRHVLKKGKVLVGFHERKSSYVADMNSCEVLPRRVSDLLAPLSMLIAGMDQKDRLPQIEVAIGDETVALVLRHLEPLTAGRPGAPAEFRPANRRPVVAAAQGSRHRAPTRRVAVRPRLHPARVRHRDAVSGPPISPRSTTPSTACWSGGPCVCCRRALTSG